jgi:hypothetical protein
MHLASDYLHPTPNRGRCRVRIFVTDGSELDVPVAVVVTELGDNPGQSVTNCIERVVGEVLHAHSLDPSETVVIEHYEDGARGTQEDPATFDLVTFPNAGPKAVLRAGRWVFEMGEPEWKPLDRKTAEALVGGRL